jgi:hypothetical protein
MAHKNVLDAKNISIMIVSARIGVDLKGETTIA